jgi:hypothetical protein
MTIKAVDNAFVSNSRSTGIANAWLKRLLDHVTGIHRRVMTRKQLRALSPAQRQDIGIELPENAMGPQIDPALMANLMSLR